MSWFDSIKKAMGGDGPSLPPPEPPRPPRPPEPPRPPDPPFPPDPPPPGGSHAALDAFWHSVGTLDDDVIAHMVSPSFTGGPHWPTPRQAYRVVRRGDTILLATDGLSDPERDGDPNGFGIELFIETADLPPDLRGGPGDVMSPARTWAFELLRYMAGVVADSRGINDQLDRYGVISIEAPGAGYSDTMRSQMPARFFDEAGSLGVLIGGPSADFAATVANPPNDPIRIAPVVLITAAELDAVRQGGGAARDRLAAALAASPTGHRSSLTRADAG